MIKTSHPPSQSDDALEQPSYESPNRVHLSWEPFLPGTSFMDIVVDDSDMHYHFYHEVLQHVRTNPHPNYFTCPCATSVSMWTDVFWNGPVKDALRHCQSFGTLINLLVDKFPDIDQLSTEAFLPTGPDSVVFYCSRPCASLQTLHLHNTSISGRCTNIPPMPCTVLGPHYPGLADRKSQEDHSSFVPYAMVSRCTN